MGNDSGDSDGKRDGAFDISAALIGRSEDSQHEDEGADDFDTEGLSFGHVGVDSAHSHTESVLFGGDALKLCNWFMKSKHRPA